MCAPNHRCAVLARHLTATGLQAAGAARRTILVTGCTSGLGRALCVEFAKLGHTVVGCGRRVAKLKELDQELGGDRHFFGVCDTSDPDAVDKFRDTVRQRGLTIDVLINNAGIGVPAAMPWDVSAADFKRIMHVNVIGVHNCIRSFIPGMIAAHVASSVPKLVVNISSGLGHSTSPVLGPYSATKWAVESLSKSVAQALRALKLDDHFVCVPLAPGAIKTELNRSRGIPTAAEWAPVAAPFILGLSKAENGASITVPKYYSKEYMETWAIPDGMPLPSGVVVPK